MNKSLDLNPLAVHFSVEELLGGDSGCLSREVRFADDADVCFLNDGGKVSVSAKSGDFNESARVQGQDRSGGECDKYAAAGVVDKHCSVPGIDVGIVVGDDGMDVDGVGSSSFLRGEAVYLMCGCQGTEGRRWRLLSVGGEREENGTERTEAMEDRLTASYSDWETDCRSTCFSIEIYHSNIPAFRKLHCFGALKHKLVLSPEIEVDSSFAQWVYDGHFLGFASVGLRGIGGSGSGDLVNDALNDNNLDVDVSSHVGEEFSDEVVDW